MNLLPLAFLIATFYISLYIFPDYKTTLLSVMVCDLYGNFHLFFKLKSTLTKYNFFFLIIIGLLHNCIQHLTAIFYFNKTEIIPTHIILTYIIVFLACVLACPKKQEVDEINESYFFSNLLQEFISPIIGVILIFNHLVVNQSDRLLKIENLSDIDINVFFTDVVLGYISLNGWVIVVGLLPTNDDKKKNFSKVILRGLVVLMLVNIVFYLNYNTKILNYVYENFISYVPQPHSLFIYNSIPLNKDSRFIMSIFGICFLDRRLSW